MGQLVNGVWQDDDALALFTDGKFVRKPSAFRNWITPDGAPGPSGIGGFKAESDRYHLYVSYACPWAHRTLIFRQIKGLAKHISFDVVHPVINDDGWTFASDYPGATGDRLFGLNYLREIYCRSDKNVTSRASVPVLWDKHQNVIVSNESSEIIRMFNSAFDNITGHSGDFWPPDMQDRIEAINTRIYSDLNNGVYKAGFARTQSAYDSAANKVFETLDWLETHLANNRYLMGDQLTEADWRLFSTLIRFDPVYHTHFKCNRKWLREYRHLWDYTRELYQWPGVSGTVNLDHITQHYHKSHGSINPHHIVPINPENDYDAPHGRDQMAATTGR